MVQAPPKPKPMENCVICGSKTYERNCKVVCSNCGYIRDCSDPFIQEGN